MQRSPIVTRAYICSSRCVEIQEMSKPVIFRVSFPERCLNPRYSRIIPIGQHWRWRLYKMFKWDCTTIDGLQSSNGGMNFDRRRSFQSPVVDRGWISSCKDWSMPLIRLVASHEEKHGTANHHLCCDIHRQNPVPCWRRPDFFCSIL